MYIVEETLASYSQVECQINLYNEGIDDTTC